MLHVDCDASTRTIHHEEHTYGTSHPAERVLEADVMTIEYGNMNWLGADGQEAHFVMDLGCQQSFQQILLRNCHNGGSRDRSTKTFR